MFWIVTENCRGEIRCGWGCSKVVLSNTHQQEDQKFRRETRGWSVFEGSCRAGSPAQDCLPDGHSVSSPSQPTWPPRCPRGCQAQPSLGHCSDQLQAFQQHASAMQKGTVFPASGLCFSQTWGKAWCPSASKNKESAFLSGRSSNWVFLAILYRIPHLLSHSLFWKEHHTLTILTVDVVKRGATLFPFLLLTLTPTPSAGPAQPSHHGTSVPVSLSARQGPTSQETVASSRMGPIGVVGRVAFFWFPGGWGAAQRGLALQLSVWVTQFPGFHAVSSSPALNCLHSNSYPQSIHMKAFLCLEDLGWQSPKVSYGGSFSIGDRCSLMMERFRVDLWFR